MSNAAGNPVAAVTSAGSTSTPGAISQSDPVLAQVQVGATEGAALLDPASPAGRRLDETRRFVEFLRAEIGQSMVEWRRLQAAERVPG